MVTSFISICLSRFGFSFFKLKWKTKNELQIWISMSSYFENRKSISFYVLRLNFSIKTKTKTLFLFSHFNLSKKRNGTLGTRIGIAYTEVEIQSTVPYFTEQYLGIPNNRYCPGNWANYKIFTFIFLCFCLNCKSAFKIKKILNRSSHRRFSVKKYVLRNFAKFKEKHLCQSLFFNKVAGLTLLKKRLWHRCFRNF